MRIVKAIGELILAIVKFIEKILHPKKMVTPEQKSMVDILKYHSEKLLRQEPEFFPPRPDLIWNDRNPLSDLKGSTVTTTPLPHPTGDVFSLNPFYREWLPAPAYRECLDDIKEIHGVVVGRVANSEEARLGINFIKKPKIETKAAPKPVLDRYEILRKKLEGKNGNI